MTLSPNQLIIKCQVKCGIKLKLETKKQLDRNHEKHFLVRFFFRDFINKMAPISKKSKSVKSKKDIKVVESIMKEEEAVVEQFSDSDPDLQELVNELDSDQDTGVQDEPEIKEDDFASAQSEIKLMMEKAQVKKRSAPSSDRAPDSEETPAVVYVGRIPHGFYEDQLKNYFSQFGQVVRLRLSRNKKTGKSKHYAFIEFENREVADIVVECMDNYLLFGHILKCRKLKSVHVYFGSYVIVV